MSFELLDMRQRQQLPEPLRYLAEQYPREAWGRQRPLGQLTQFWLDRHLMFRKLLGQLSSEAEALAQEPGQVVSFCQRLPRLGGFLVQNLHGHHQIEDHHYFPLLKGHDQRLARGFELLDLDHQALDAALDGFVTSAQGVLAALQTQAEAGHETALPSALAGYQTGLDSLSTWLERHLFDEEELIVPILLHYGEPQL